MAGLGFEGSKLQGVSCCPSVSSPPVGEMENFWVLVREVQLSSMIIGTTWSVMTHAL
jgi:hypothetical protein